MPDLLLKKKRPGRRWGERMTEYEIASVILQGFVFVALVVTVAIYYRQLKSMEQVAADVANTNRKVVAFRMFERWNSDSMWFARASVAPVFNSCYQHDSTKIFLGDLFHAFHTEPVGRTSRSPGDSAEAYRSISTLIHFLLTSIAYGAKAH